MRHYNECTKAEQDEINLLAKYGSTISKDLDEEFRTWIIWTEEELWNEQYTLRQLIKKKILEILW